MNGLVFFLLLSTCLFLVICAKRENGLKVTVRSSLTTISDGCSLSVTCEPVGSLQLSLHSTDKSSALKFDDDVWVGIAYVRHNARRNKVSQVEMSAGAIKHDIEKYPVKFFERRLKYLLKVKAKKDKAKKKPK